MTDGRDRSIDILLRQRRESDVGPQVSLQCLDGEVLAAWMEGALSGKALADAETHAASCARCQALLASMARTMPHADAREWWRVLSAKWLVPVAAVATALLVWVAVEQSPEPAPKPTLPPGAPVGSVRAPAAASAEPVTPVPDQNAQSQFDSRLKAAVDASKAKKETAERRAGAAGAAGQVAEEKAAPQPQRLDALDKTADAVVRQSAARSESPTDASRPVVSATPPVAAPPPLPAAGTPPPAAPAAPPQSKTAVSVPSVAESVIIVPEANKPIAGPGGGRAAFAAVPEIRSPQSDYRWRILPPSGIQRSVDGGVTWSVVDPVPAQGAVAVPALVLTTGSSPSRDVCWIVGRAGIVLLTVDGATWQRHPISEAVDLSTVRAVDARTATVTTVDGRQFATSDGGTTWVLVK